MESTRNPMQGFPGNLEAESALGKRKAPPANAVPETGPVGGVSGTGCGSQYQNDPEVNNLWNGEAPRQKKLRLDLPTTVPKEDLERVNKEVLSYVGPRGTEDYYCTLCHTRLTSVSQLERHTVANEHLRRITSISRDKPNANKYCEVCQCACSCDDIFQNHLKGRKHQKNMGYFMIGKHMKVTTIGDDLEQLLRKDVVSEGNGITLGLSNTMTGFFTLKGPFIGLQHAVETGRPEDTNPGYICTLCNVAVDANNFHLHFTSSAHRVNVLKNDYPDKYQAALKVGETSSTKGDFNNHLRDVATEIEAKEGKKIELIQRRILKSKSFKTNFVAPGQGESSQPRGRFMKRGKRGALNTTQHSSERGVTNRQSEEHHDSRDFSGRGRGFIGSPQMGGNQGRMQPRKNSDNWTNDNPEQFPAQGRGANQGGMQYRNQSDNWSSDNRQDQYRGRGNSGHGYAPRSPQWGESNSRGNSRAKQRSSSYSGGYNDELFGDYPSSGRYNYGEPPISPPYNGPKYSSPTFAETPPHAQASPRQQSQFQYPPSQNDWPPPRVQYPHQPRASLMYSNPAPPRAVSPPRPIPPPTQRVPPPTEQPQKSLLNTLARSSIKTDDDFKAAFHLSTALTQAMLSYRLNDASNDTEKSPNALLSMLNSLQGNSKQGPGSSEYTN